jgi:hypothetical protein
LWINYEIILDLYGSHFATLPLLKKVASKKVASKKEKWRQKKLENFIGIYYVLCFG